MEIERKYLITAPPVDLAACPHHIIEQGYLCTDPVVRIRREDDTFYLTYKGRGLMAREEYNLPLSAEAYAHLLPKIDGCLIPKTRYLIPLDNGLTAELDHFKSPLSGLYLVEVEFPDIAGADAFVPPSWFGQEVTEDPFYHNSAMSRLDPSTSAASSRPPRG